MLYIKVYVLRVNDPKETGAHKDDIYCTPLPYSVLHHFIFFFFNCIDFFLDCVVQIHFVILKGPVDCRE
jgi:hypothetical protein